jgi:hypothetical protein
MLLTELRQLRNVLYHITTIDNATKILQSTQFILSGRDALGVDVPPKLLNGWNTPIQYYFLSTARSPASSFISVSSGRVLLVLDREQISHNYKILPYNYHKDEKQKLSNRVLSEYEDRIISSKPIIPTDGFIRQVRILGTTNNEAKIQQLEKICKTLNIPSVVFDNRPQFQYNNSNTTTRYHNLVDGEDEL